MQLKRKESVNLTRKSGGSNLYECRVGWDASPSLKADIDIMAILQNQDGKAVDTVYFNNLKVNGVSHSGDNRTGEGEGWDEIISIDTTKLNSGIERISVICIIYNPSGVTFGDIKNVKCQVYDAANQQDLASFAPELEFGNSKGVILGEFVKNGTDWFFKASGDAHPTYDETLKTFGLSF